MDAAGPVRFGATTLAILNRVDPNGIWSLFLVEEEGGGGGILGGWCLDITFDERGPQARPTTTSAPNAAGWYHGDVTVNWNWSDAVSGVDPPAAPTGRAPTTRSPVKPSPTSLTRSVVRDRPEPADSK